MAEVLRLRNERANDPHAAPLNISELQSLARANIAAKHAAQAEAARIEMLEAQALADARAQAAAARAAAARQAQANAAAQADAARQAQADAAAHTPATAASDAASSGAAQTNADVAPLDHPDKTDSSDPAGGKTPGSRSGRSGQGARDDRQKQDGAARSAARETGLATSGHPQGLDDLDDHAAARHYVDAQGAALAARFDERLALTQQSIEHVASRAYSGVAAGMAMPNLTPREPGGVLVAAGAARYRSGSAFAAGATYRTRNSRWLVHAALAVTDCGDTGVRTHIGYEF